MKCAAALKMEGTVSLPKNIDILCMCARSVTSDSSRPRGPSLPGSSVHGFSRQQYWGRLPFPSPEDLPYPGIKF